MSVPSTLPDAPNTAPHPNGYGPFGLGISGFSPWSFFLNLLIYISLHRT